MSLGLWAAAYSVVMAFWIWIIRWGGAEKLEETLANDFSESLANYLSADTVKIVGYVALGVSSLWFIAGVYLPGLRFWVHA